MSREFEYRIDIIENVGPLEYNFSVDENVPEVFNRFVIIEKVSKKIYRNTTGHKGCFPYEWSANHTVMLPSNYITEATDLDIMSFGC